MVDQINGLGQIQGISSTNKTQNSRENREGEQAARTQPQDEVQISEEAQDLISAQQAEEEAQVLSQGLAEDTTQSLGLDPNFDQEV